MAEIDSRIPQVGLRFRNCDEARQFWVAYGYCTGFAVTSCRYICSNEGHRRKGQTDHVTKCFRAETRTDCKARMIVTVDRVAGNYEVTDVVLEHNHLLHLPETFHLMKTQRKISELQAFEIETADEYGIRPNAAHEMVARQVGGPFNLSYTCRVELAFGQAGSMLKYFHEKVVENPSFQYALQLDCEEHITNIFWADAKMVLDYAYFGDVVTFDTTFGTNKEYRPFGVFLGMNQFRETTMFGEEEGEKEEDEPHILRDFNACIYGHEDEASFEETFQIMRSKVHKQTWLDSIYKLSDCFNNALKNHLKYDFDIIRFLKHFERSVQEKRDKKLEFEFEARKNIPRRLMCTPMLVQASQVYTPVIFEAFQGEYERSMAACARVLDGEHKYAVVVGNLLGELSSEVEYIVLGDPLHQKRILCAHSLKVLDLMNIKRLPLHYILNRWTREAHNGNILDRQGRNVVANSKLEAQLWYKFMSHKFHNLTHKVAHSPECCVMLEINLIAFLHS
ncbi:hypothetical protein PVAP13_2NG103318 [Panicum virgatum]|uniref:FAR1 domain-containing protein n=1 Tax=Panicum virgatum TaxID=38727 RepID=A0A8T0VDZ2_PANVG|nr:hypothetical protein PVAP13_2NG103318 [Panicum virgatum]